MPAPASTPFTFRLGLSPAIEQCRAARHGPSPQEELSEGASHAVAQQHRNRPAAKPKPIAEIGRGLGIPPDEAVIAYGPYKAKIDLPCPGRARRAARTAGWCWSRPSPRRRPARARPPTSVGLARRAQPHRAAGRSLCLREPSLGPCFGMKGGAAGGGYAQVDPDGGHQPPLHRRLPRDHRRATTCSRRCSTTTSTGATPSASTRAGVTWRRAVDMNDRALRSIVVGPRRPANGFPREDGFDITVASEVMAIFCLADGPRRPGAAPRPTSSSAYDRDRQPGDGPRPQAPTAPMTRAAQGRDRAQPRADAGGHPGPRPRRALRQHRPRLQLGRSPPAPGSSSATSWSPRPGFGADLGAEKFFDIKCRLGRPPARPPRSSSPRCGR